MKKSIKTISLLLLLGLTACNKVETQTFGEFSYHGAFLIEYATKQIGVEEAKKLVNVSTYSNKPMTKRVDYTNEDNTNDVDIVLKKYGSLLTTVKYYVSEEDKQQVRQDLYQGTDYKNLLESNYYEPFGQMSVRYLFVNDDLLDEMEEQNIVFEDENKYLVNPFNEPFTYHTNEDNQLIIQTHHFAELPASIGGGIGSTFRQDCESIFDKEGKIVFWQSSLGLYTSTPTGTVQEGYIFEVEFEWINK